MFGKITNPKNEKLEDMNPREIAYFAPLIALVFILGFFPTPFIKKMEPSVASLVAHVQARNCPMPEGGDKQIKPAQQEAAGHTVAEAGGASTISQISHEDVGASSGVEETADQTAQDAQDEPMAGGVDNP